MGPIGAFMEAINDISGMSALLPSTQLFFGRVPQRLTQPPAAEVTDEGRDPLILTAEFELPQVYVYNLTCDFWTATLANCEAWAALMDSRWAFQSLSVDGFTSLPASTEVGRVVFMQEPKLDSFASLMHRCTYPVKIPLEKDS